MDLIRITNGQLAYGTHPLLDGANAVIEQGERVCVVGRNGAGKSTFLKVLSGDVILDDGDINQVGELKIARLEQDPPRDSEGSVFDYVADGLPTVAKLLKEFHALNAQLAEHADDEKALSRLASISADIEAQDGWRFDSKIKLVLGQLELDADAQLATLSGGWLRKVALAKALVGEPDLLLLDEPTNHLDVASVKWLEQFLKEFKGAIIFISHDRAFIRALATRILDLDRGQLVSYPGDYATYLERKAHDLKVQEQQNAEFDKKLAEEEAWIRQGIKARRTRNEGRVRALKALRQERKQRIEQVGKVDLNIETAARSGKLVAEAKHLCHAFGDKVIVDDFSTLLMRGDRVGLVGPNGVGKTTLLKLLFGQLQSTKGQLKQGVNLEIAYFDQYRAKLDEEASVQDNVADGKQEVNVGGRSRHVLGYLQDFLFPPKRARTPVKALSGGEKNRLLLAKIFLQPSNVLVLDEPTNDLDIETLELLEDIVNQYQGTVLIVSHDREFIDNTCSSVWGFDGNGKITEVVGGYSDYEAYRAQQLAALEAQRKASAEAEQQQAQSKTSKPKSSNKLSYKHKRELETLPEQVEQFEQAIDTLQQEVNSSDFFKQDNETTSAKLNQLAELESKLEAAFARWEELEELQNQ
ncbi:ABC transporter ATP-binding protein [Pseudoalteromonas sp. CNC9-20]|uniref:ATP-binding cassette ATPase Uup n=1 Tax=Pseudoalteromonas sp. CNC9-20 TaxID=2917750 RepID=UPI001EF68DE2|nr:ABC transporter ATP-binding protein [Pseudoalteromonas sp. CNC9-20]MCG7568854.1 ABC transporter ATP-binding protein [Pseudoalteromonas sp. CNC9-20]